MRQDRAGNVPFAAEIVPPAMLAGPAGKLLTRGEVARRLGLSLSTVRRMEGVQLKPIVGERGVRYFEETEIQTVLVRVRRTRVPLDEHADGTLAAAAFTRFRNGADVVAVVTELRVVPETIESLFEHWKALARNRLARRDEPHRACWCPGSTEPHRRERAPVGGVRVQEEHRAAVRALRAGARLLVP